MTQGQSYEGPHKQNVQLGDAAERKKWRRRHAARSNRRPSSKDDLRLIPLPPGQALLRPALLPVGPRMRADDAAVRADHPRAERGHRHGIAIAVHIQHCFVVTEFADDPKRAHALARMLASVIGGPRWRFGGMR